jgi:prevent-host-death family protein
MQRFSSTAFKTHVSDMFSAAAQQPIEITQHGKTAFVLMSETRYRELEALEDAYWGERAIEALKSGIVRGEEAETTIQNLLAEKVG